MIWFAELLLSYSWDDDAKSNREQIGQFDISGTSNREFLAGLGDANESVSLTHAPLF
jgi:hypothetical protein